jgi:hypothetical protein
VRAWLGIDDRDDVVGSDAQVAAWRDWLAIGNVLQFLEPGRFHAHTLSTVASAPASASKTTTVTPAWQEIAETFDGSQKELILHLAACRSPSPDTRSTTASSSSISPGPIIRLRSTSTRTTT